MLSNLPRRSKSSIRSVGMRGREGNCQQLMQGSSKVSQSDSERLIQTPHDQPMVLVDRIIDIALGRQIRGIKNVSIREQYFSVTYRTVL
jgi:hypothetical protein